MESKYNKVTHVLFDMDGLLLDTEYLYTEAFNRIIKKYNSDNEFTWEVKAKIMGFHCNDSAKEIIRIYNLPLSTEEFLEQLTSIYEELFPNSKFMPDSESVYKMIFHKIVSEFGHKYEGDIRYAVLGSPEVIGFKLIIDWYKLPISVEEFSKKYHQLQEELFDEVRVMPGAVRLLQHLKKHNIPIALATSSSKTSFELKTTHLKPMFELFHHRVLGGSDPDVKTGKPAPDIFLVAAKRFDDDPEPAKCLVFEDAPNGVQAAVSAGMQVVMVPDSSLPKELTKKATMVIGSLEEFKPELFGLPPFDD